MKPVAWIGLAAALALAIVAGSVFAAGDRQTFVSPPEAVAEDFVRALAGGRYDVAMTYVDAGAGITRDEIRRRSDELRRRAGGIEGVDDSDAWMNGDVAGVLVAIETRAAGTIAERLSLAWTGGRWSITR